MRASRAVMHRRAESNSAASIDRAYESGRPGLGSGGVVLLVLERAELRAVAARLDWARNGTGRPARLAAPGYIIVC